MDQLTSRPSLGIGIGIAAGTTAVTAVVLAMGGSWAQWLGIASLILLGEGILIAVLAYRGPGVPRTRMDLPPTTADIYQFEAEWRQRPEPVGSIKRSQFRMALPPLVLGVIFFLLTDFG
jgi:hypothetical protein